MKMMNEVDRKKIITEVFEYGGIGLRRQTLRVHKNGAKFPISKNYIDDEVLNSNTTYTLILIPEVKIALQSCVLLSFFSRRKGPNLFYSYPEKAITETEKINIIQNMDQAFKQEFFVQESSTIPSSINFYFEITSEWARGEKEMLLLSIVINKAISPILERIIQPICKDFATQLRNEKNAFKGIYHDHLERVPETSQSDPEINTYCNALKEWIKKVYIQIIQSIEP